ncbi:MAG TPA: efflux RND transporter periplasmic adaptor subunit [Bryobacteraceae bacterium]|nr:efflux RND transporter periplasmic adaptor subunit [Bryobacteraceae bacterium]
MKKKWKFIILLGLVLVITVSVFASIKISQRGVVTVQTGNVARTDLTAIVTASGEVKPRNYINIGANTQGAVPIVAIYVKEGDHVKKGQVLARLADIQPQADYNAQQAAVNSAMADSAASEANDKSAEHSIAVALAQVDHDRADVEQKKLDFKRSQDLFNEKLIAAQDFEAKKIVYDLAVATLQSSLTKVDQARAARAQAAAQSTSYQRKITQSQAMLARQRDVLSRYDAAAPLDGVVTDLPMRVGETVVPGIQNSVGSTIMTIADMSIITAEVHVDETDIVSVKLDQPADVTIDAIPNRIFKGKIIEIGDTALVRSTGVAASQSTTSSQEAKDFKVIIALDIPETLVRPGLSCTAKITTDMRPHALAIPIQALTIRQKGQLKQPKPGEKMPTDPASLKAAKEELQGVFVVNNGKAQFREVKTGISGATDIEVLSGLKDGDQIVTGSYQVIRTIRNDAKVKIDNKPMVLNPTAG